MEWVNLPQVIGTSHRVQYLLATLSIAGLQFIWSIEQAYVNIYLLSLGLERSHLSLLWIASPLCGLLVQPMIGIISDNCTLKTGRRRPFIIWGAIITIISLLAFSWAEELANYTQWNRLKIAISAVIITDVFINMCQICCRALIVDMFPGERQTIVNGWASLMAAVGHFISYLIGSYDLTWLNFGTQLQSISVLYSIVLMVCVGITCAACSERVLIKSPRFRNKRSMFNLLRIFRDVFKSAGSLDPKLSDIFKVQFCSWYGWFTFLFYGSTYASAIWMTSGKESNVGEIARAGSYAMSFFAASSTIFTLILPSIKLNIVNVWTFALVLYALSVLSTWVVSSYTQILILFSVLGFPWAATLWVPFSLTAERIHQLPDEPHALEDSHLDNFIRVQPVETDQLLLGDIPDGHVEKSGMVLGLHNAAITLPQFVSTFGSYAIFKIFDADPKDPFIGGGKVIALTLQVGAVTSLMAALLTRRILNDHS